ncbi:Copia protein, partial [Mucuna pruriens]
MKARRGSAYAVVDASPLSAARLIKEETPAPLVVELDLVGGSSSVVEASFAKGSVSKRATETSYELWKGRQPNISYFHPFGYECFILNSKDYLGKFDPKSDNGIFFKYFETSKAYKDQAQVSLLFELKSKTVEEDLMDDGWIKFQKNEVWKLVALPKDRFIIGTKWVFRNKLNENGKVVRNKKSFTSYYHFQLINHIRLHQMDVKNAFLNGIINEEVYVKQTPNFESDYFPDHVFKLKKSLDDLKQEPNAWYEKLRYFLMENGFSRGKVDTTLFHKNYGSYFIIVQIYIDDIIYGATDDSMWRILWAYVKRIRNEHDEGIEIKQTINGIYIHQIKYVEELLKKFKLDDCKNMSTLMHPTSALNLDDFDKKVDRITYRGQISCLVYVCRHTFNLILEKLISQLKWIFRYLKGTTNLGNKIERKNTNGCYHFVGVNLKHNTLLLLVATHNCSRSSINLNNTTSMRVLSFYFKEIFDIKFINTKLVDIHKIPY